MYSQRKKERRNFGGKASFPLKTNGGLLVEKDRRSIPDRRIGNIHLELVDDVGYGLPDYLLKMARYTTSKAGC